MDQSLARPATYPAQAPEKMPGGSTGVLLLGAVSVAAAVAITSIEPTLAPVFLLPAAIAGAIACATRPAAAVIGLFVLVGFQGTLLAYTTIPGRNLVDLVLVGLWIGVIWRMLAFKQRPLWLWPGVLFTAIYILITFCEAFVGASVLDGLDAFHLATWPMMAVLLVGLAPWSPETFERIAKGVLIVALVVGLYALFRWVTGPAGEELQVAKGTRPDYLEEFKLFGSLPTPPHLAAWGAVTGAFALAMVLGLKGRWRVVAAAATFLSGFAVFASEVRTGILAAAIGFAFALGLFAAARAYPGGLRLARVAVIGGTALIASLTVYVMTIGGSPSSADRFARILTPSEDFAYSAREARWEEALEDMSRHPVGRGLGTAGSAARFKAEADPDFIANLDSSYLKVGVEQGPWVLALYVISLLLLVFGIAWRAIMTSDPMRASIGIGASAALVALAVLFYAGTFVEEQQALAAWLLVGLGVAQFARPAEKRERADFDSPAPVRPAAPAQ
jgi:hypothetical protein